MATHCPLHINISRTWQHMFHWTLTCPEHGNTLSIER